MFYAPVIGTIPGVLLVFLALGFSLRPAWAADTNAPHAIGIEGRLSVDLPRGDYRPRPLDDRTELILRIERVQPVPPNQHRYEFHYMGLETGDYRLAEYLIRPDGSRPDELGDLRVRVRAVLPENHDGKLNAYVPRRFPFLGGYRAALVALTVLWVGGIITFIVLSRRKRVVAAPAVVVPEPSFAERIRPLVLEAAEGRLDLEGQATLERLLMGFWREKLNLSDLPIAEALSRLKLHAEAGELLRALERWLHRPGGVSREEISALLEPYRKIPAPATSGEEVAA
jgi:hypothetical protein